MTWYLVSLGGVVLALLFYVWRLERKVGRLEHDVAQQDRAIIALHWDLVQVQKGVGDE